MRKSFGSREKVFYRERSKKMKNQIAPQLYIEKHSSIDRGAIEICQALNLNRYKFVKVLSRIYQWQKYLDGSRSCRESIGQKKKFLDELRSCREAIETNSRKLDGSKLCNFCREKKKDGLDRCETVEDLSRSY